MAGSDAAFHFRGLPGYIGSGEAPSAVHAVPLFPARGDDSAAQSSAIALVRGARLYVKGRYVAHSDTPINAAFERFAVGLVSSAVFATVDAAFGSETETTRDDLGTTAIVVDDAEAIKSYNCAAAGDASYTDSTFVADLSAGMEFEVIISLAAAAATMANATVTVKARDSAGTLRTILNEVAPASGNNLYLFLLMNQDAHVENLWYRLERGA